MRADIDRHIPMHAMCSPAQEDGNAHFEGQIVEYGQLGL